MRERADRWARHQVALYLLALALGTAIGLAIPAVVRDRGALGAPNR